MPQTSPELAAKFPGMDQEAMKVLKDAGYTLTKQWAWRLPNPNHTMTEREKDAVDYLIEEWDFDGVLPNEEITDD